MTPVDTQNVNYITAKSQISHLFVNQISLESIFNHRDNTLVANIVLLSI